MHDIFKCKVQLLDNDAGAPQAICTRQHCRPTSVPVQNVGVEVPQLEPTLQHEAVSRSRSSQVSQ